MQKALMHSALGLEKKSYENYFRSLTNPVGGQKEEAKAIGRSVDFSF